MKTKNLGFTLVELIVVITILAILGTIGFITLQGYSASARDTKRISDISSLASKINIEQIRGVDLKDLIKEIREEEGQILGTPNQRINTFGKVNFDNLRETRSNFLDPSTKGDYPVSYAIGMGSNSIRYRFFEIGTISEKENKTKIVGNYYTLTQEDIPSLFLSGRTEYINNGSNLIYSPNDNYIPPVIGEPEEEITHTCQNSEGIILENTITNNTENLTEDTNYQNIDNTQSCYYECKTPYNGTRCDETIEIYGDEGAEEIAICNAWVEENVGELGGGAENWLWVPARHFTTDGTGIGMEDDYYKREITYNGINYTCNGFAVAKYEMTYEEAINPNSTLGGTDFNTYKYNSSLTPISIPNRYPIADITQPQAISACRSIGTNINGKDFHLITNNEWMTIARNIEQQDINWSNNEVGSGYISHGLTYGSLGCFGTSNILYGEERLYATKTGEGSNENCDNKRQLNISNGNKIWDLSGNVWEHINKGNTIDGSGNSIGMTKIDDNRENWNITNSGAPNEYYSWHKYGWTSLSITEDERKKYGPGNVNYGGLGSIAGWWLNRDYNIFLRGAGNSSGNSIGGMFTISLRENDDFFKRDIGFRCSL